jgi:multidrug resistance efflux pump
MGYKKILMRATVVFGLFLLFLTFFSRTLADMRLPRVSMAFIQSGVIAPEAMSFGLVTAADTERVFAPVSGRILQIMELGDLTDSASVLFTLSVDVRTLYDQLDRAHHEQRMINLNTERTQSEISNAQSQLSRLRAEPLNIPVTPVLNLLEFDMQLAANTHDMAAMEESLQTLESLYSIGIIPRQQITDRENDIARLVQARETINQRRLQAIEDYEQALLNHEDSLNTAARNRDTQIRNQQNIITQLNFQIRVLELDSERVEKQIESLLEQIEEGGVYQVRPDTSPNRLITQIMPGLDIGSYVSEGMPVMATAIRNNRFVIEAHFPQSQEFIRANQQVEITVGTIHLEGTTNRVIPQGGQNLVVIEFASNELRGGEIATVNVRDRAANAQHIIPVGALRSHTTGYFILYVETEEGRFGNHYYLRSVMVEPGRRDARHVAISGRHGMALPQDPIVLNSDVPVNIGDRVRLAAD